MNYEAELRYNAGIAMNLLKRVCVSSQATNIWLFMLVVMQAVQLWMVW